MGEVSTIVDRKKDMTRDGYMSFEGGLLKGNREHRGAHIYITLNGRGFTRDEGGSLYVGSTPSRGACDESAWGSTLKRDSGNGNHFR